MRKLALCLMTCFLASPPTMAQEALSFQNKTVTMIIGFAAGVGTGYP